MIGDNEPNQECLHDWIAIHDWGGDPEVIGGTFDYSFWRCQICGDETGEDPFCPQRLTAVPPLTETRSIAELGGQKGCQDGCNEVVE